MTRALIWLQVNEFAYLCRDKNTQSVARAPQLQSKQMGHRVNRVTNMEGRVTFDLLAVLLRDYKLRSYTLNSVSYHFLKEQKEDVPYQIISDLQVGCLLLI